MSDTVNEHGQKGGWTLIVHGPSDRAHSRSLTISFIHGESFVVRAAIFPFFTVGGIVNEHDPPPPVNERGPVRPRLFTDKKIYTYLSGKQKQKKLIVVFSF